MRLVKRLSNKTWSGKDGKEHHYVNYFIELDNGKRVAIKTIDAGDLKVLDGVAVYESTRK